MCNLSQGVMEKGVAKGIGIGEERGENKATLNAIRNVMNSFKVSVDAAMDALHGAVLHRWQARCRQVSDYQMERQAGAVYVRK